MFIITIAVATLSLTDLSYSGSGPLGLNLNVGINLHEKNVESPIYNDIVDWRKVGAVTPVKRQHRYSCVSSWAFAATGALEGQQFRKTEQLVSLSEQNLIDCSKENNGCDGGVRMDSAFEYVKQNGGIDTEKSYPYEAKQRKCRYDPSNAGANCTGFKYIALGDEKALQEAVKRIGPIAVAIEGHRPSFMGYRGGYIYDDPDCDHALNYALLVVGYGVEVTQGIEYWIAKNSWGPKWGEEGYIRIARNKNMCGIALMASYPTV